MVEPRDNSGTTNQARNDALSDVKKDTRLWSDEARRTYDTIHDATKKSST